ncbi:Uncharacterised protein [Mycobacteroides abscessus subsp. massiliense]|nr:Uncharacterised protein [Mycobacteroides abscessus subsp. massiliense]
MARRRLHDALSGLVPDDGVQRIGALGCRVLRVCVIDVQAGPVGQDHVGRPHFVGIDDRRRAGGAPQVESASVAQRRLHLIVPAGALGTLDPRCRGVRQHRLRRREDRIGGGVRGRRNAVLNLGTDDPLHGVQPREAMLNTTPGTVQSPARAPKTTLASRL